MRIVLDTNVLARAIRGGTGPAAELLGIVMVPPHTFILSLFFSRNSLVCFATSECGNSTSWTTRSSTHTCSHFNPLLSL